MDEIKVTSLAKLYMMMLLNEGPKHGYELIKKVEEKLGKKPSPSQIYPFLRELEKLGYIRSKGVGERDRHVYFLTAEGRGFVGRLFVRFGALIDIAVRPRLSVCAHCGCEIYSGGHKERINGRILTFCCRHCAGSFKSGA